jgi:hypothetical protein
MTNQELASPYIPIEFIQQFEQLYIEISEKVLVAEIKNKYETMTKMKMLSEVYDGKKLNINVLSFFLGKFAHELDQIDLQFINKIFLDRSIDNNTKLFVLTLMKDADISYEFDFYNSMINTTIKINSKSDFEFEQTQYFNKVAKLIEDALAKEPSLIVIAKELLMVIYEYHFNTIPPYSVELLSNNLRQHVLRYFEQDKQQLTEFDN